MSRTQQISHVFVDFDGTLVDTLGCLYNTYCQFLTAYKIESSKKEFNTFNGPSLNEIIGTLKAKYGLTKSAPELLREYLDLIDKNYKHAQPFSDAQSFLAELYAKNKKMILVTSSREEIVLPLIQKFTWQSYFSDYVWAENIKKSKPAPDIYLEAWRRSEAAKDSIVAIEDSVNGVVAAHSAGLVVWGLSLDAAEEDLKKAGASMVFSNLTQALAAFT